MKILFEDEHIIVCVKERGLLSQDGNGKASMVDKLSEYTGSVIYPVHRLDKDVAGVMVYAKSQKAAANLSAQVSDRRMKKEYLAIVHGEADKGTMEDLLFFDRSKNKSFVVKKERRGVKKALLSYETLERKADKSLVRVSLHTGRTHQIRIQFASRKMPLFGDRRYGGKDDEKTIALWSCRISFEHPESKKVMEFELLPDGDKAFAEFYNR
ncbi:MAG: RluA family pseudouridine synthase [Clostridia bacterium]|nr:RluA family pseudouridine synthase [Clostridia bacterium]